MRVSVVEQAAWMFDQYGNVGTMEELLKVKPTEHNLREACFQVKNNLRNSLRLIREHHNMIIPLGGDYS